MFFVCLFVFPSEKWASLFIRPYIRYFKGHLRVSCQLPSSYSQKESAEYIDNLTVASKLDAVKIKCTDYSRN